MSSMLSRMSDQDILRGYIPEHVRPTFFDNRAVAFQELLGIGSIEHTNLLHKRHGQFSEKLESISARHEK